MDINLDVFNKLVLFINNAKKNTNYELYLSNSTGKVQFSYKNSSKQILFFFYPPDLPPAYPYGLC
jgi:hypothetical protein